MIYLPSAWLCFTYIWASKRLSYSEFHIFFLPPHLSPIRSPSSACPSSLTQEFTLHTPALHSHCHPALLQLRSRPLCLYVLARDPWAVFCQPGHYSSSTPSNTIPYPSLPTSAAKPWTEAMVLPPRLPSVWVVIWTLPQTLPQRLPGDRAKVCPSWTGDRCCHPQPG